MRARDAGATPPRAPRPRRPLSPGMLSSGNENCVGYTITRVLRSCWEFYTLCVTVRANETGATIGWL